jgi:hypothetical protein
MPDMVQVGEDGALPAKNSFNIRGSGWSGNTAFDNHHPGLLGAYGSEHKLK